MTIFYLLDRLAFLRGMPSVVVLLVAAFVAVAAWDARVTLPALLVHYLFAGLLFVDVLVPRLAVVYTLSGLFVIAILAVTAWQINWGRPPGGLTPEEATRLGLPRAMALGPFYVTYRNLIRMGLAAATLAAVFLLPDALAFLDAAVPAEIAYLKPAIAGLVGLGLIGVVTSAEPFPSGVGLLLFVTGFSLAFGFRDQSLAMTVALVVVQLVVALVIAYLAQARYLPADVLD